MVCSRLLQNVVLLVARSCSTNELILQSLKCPLTAFAGEVYLLAIKKVISDDKSNIEDVLRLIKRL